MRVCVIGSGTVPEATYEVATEVGRELGRRDHTVVCGGLSGVMEAACRGAAEADGHTVGILPGVDHRAANEFVETAVATGLGNARNALVALNADAGIAIDGAYGTLSEIAFLLDAGLPVAGIDTHDVEGVEAVSSPMAAVEYVEAQTPGDPGEYA